MAFSDMLTKLVISLCESAVKSVPKAMSEYSKKQEAMYKQYESNLQEAERKINQAEKNGVQKTTEQQQKIREAKEKLEKAKEKLKTSPINNYQVNNENAFEYWDKKWICIGRLKDANLTPYNHFVGLYKHVINGKVMYIGRAIELNNGGFRKRLSDYRRQSDSARTHTSGQIINSNLDKITTYILIVGSTAEAVKTTKKLEGIFINEYKPPWNVQTNI